MNKVFLIGNFTRDPELSETSSGVSICHFSIAVNRKYSESNGERLVDFFNCTAWRGLAETIAQYCKKGNKIALTGSIQIRNYEDNEGNKRIAVDVVAQEAEFLTPKAEEGGKSAQKERSEKKKPAMSSFYDDGDIPF